MEVFAKGKNSKVYRRLTLNSDPLSENDERLILDPKKFLFGIYKNNKQRYNFEYGAIRESPLQIFWLLNNSVGVIQELPLK